MSAFCRAPVVIRPISDHRAVRRGVEHLAVEHAPVLERNVERVPVFRLRPVLEFHDACLPTRTELELIWNFAQVARTALHASGSTESSISHTWNDCNLYANRLPSAGIRRRKGEALPVVPVVGVVVPLRHPRGSTGCACAIGGPFRVPDNAALQAAPVREAGTRLIWSLNLIRETVRTRGGNDGDGHWLCHHDLQALVRLGREARAVGDPAAVLRKQFLQLYT